MVAIIDVRPARNVESHGSISSGRASLEEVLNIRRILRHPHPMTLSLSQKMEILN